MYSVDLLILRKRLIALIEIYCLISHAQIYGKISKAIKSL